MRLVLVEELIAKATASGALEGMAGLPTMQSVSDALNVSANYLSGLLKVLTGQSTQQHIN